MDQSVSVIVTAYNAAKHLNEAIISILTQTYNDFELILVDDGSTDDTLSIMMRHQEKDPRIIVDTHENLGISRSANRALHLAKGKIIVRMDADDIMRPNRIEKQLKYFREHPNVTMLSCDAEFINEKSEVIGRQSMPGYDHPDHSREIAMKSVLVACAHTGFTTYRKSIMAVDGYNETISCVVDLELFTRMIENGETLIIIREAMMHYRMHKNSVMADGIKNLKLQHTQDLVITNMVRRRSGLEELSYEQFLLDLNDRSFFARMNDFRKKTAYSLYRASAIYFGNSEYVKFFTNLVTSLIMYPERLIAKSFVHFLNMIKRR